MQIEHKPLIITLKLDNDSQSFFDRQRKLYYPPERNFLQAHLTLFHQLPDTTETFEILAGQKMSSIDLQVTGLMSLGSGVAYVLASADLIDLHKRLSQQFRTKLIPQDRQGFRPHISIQNKVTAQKAQKLLKELSTGFKPFSILGVGLQLWRYLDGPWELVNEFEFNS